MVVLFQCGSCGWLWVYATGKDNAKYKMNIKELHSFKLSDAVAFHDKLNPKLFVGQYLRPEVSKQLKIIANDFLTELGIRDLAVKDITISGSNAAYSYTPNSDLDLHILVDMNMLSNDEIYRELFNAKKTIYNDSHDVKIHGVPVELYVQDTNEPVKSLGEYSILDDKWLRLPTKRRANLDQAATKLKYQKLEKLINRAIKSNSLSKISEVLKTIKRYRQAGLDKGGEFGPENLAYKALRSQGLITKLYQLRDRLHSEKLTIETMYQNPSKIQESMEIHNYKKLDKILGRLCQLVVKGQDSDKDYGMVAAGVLDPDNNLVSRLNIPAGNGKRIHAERAAIEAYERKYGPVPKGSIVVTTLSPCNETHDETAHERAGENCTEYLNGKGIEKVYCGYMDHTQDNDIRDFNIIETNDKDIRHQCKKFADTFLDEDSPMQFASEKTPAINPYGGLKDVQYRGSIGEASGYIPSEKEKNDPRFKTALTVDVRPDAIKKNAKAFGFKTTRAGIPPTLKPSGELWQ